MRIPAFKLPKHILYCQTDATLDNTKNNCLNAVTDGEELKNNRFFTVGLYILAVIFLQSRASRWRGG